MKNLILTISVMAFLSLGACGQAGKDVPGNVKTVFSKKFPNALKVKWDNEEENEWEAEFKMDGKIYSANFDNDGNWMETEYEISANDIPAIVKATLKKDFTDYKIEESELSETPDGKVYEFELEKGKEEIKVTIDMNGKVVKKEAKEEEDEEDDD